MDKNGIAKRYAVAIYDIAKSMSNIEEIRETLNLLVEKYKEEEDFKNFLLNPIVTVDEKESFLRKTFDFISEDALKVVNYMVSKDRIEFIPLIREKYFELYYKGKGRLPVVGIFTKELSESQKNKLTEKLEKKYGKKIVLNLEIDENILGGGIIKVGSNVINGSLKHQIEDMKRMF
ncbi:MAG: ATP synthase F1 subunit delta [Leptotrichiaceae bacterium]|nr:ATP synthase F1 subunit delta [Leptotrichiaceae bacterium]MBP7101340.1 ATP synthase F1 subunit delta [Leptotrichiaceae bacterium]